jgi:hypothetical protein
MKVIATAKGYFGQVREPGDEFEVPDNTGKSSWFERVKKSKHADADQGHKPDADKADPI